MDSYLVAVVWGRIICFIFIMMPFVTYCVWLFWKNRNKAYVQKRRPILAVIVVIIVIFCAFSWVFLDNATCYFEFCKNISFSSHILIQHLPLGPFMILIAARVHFLYFDLKYSEAILSHKWWQNISDKKDWFIQRKNVYGKLGERMYAIIISLSFFYILAIIVGVILSNQILYNAATAIVACVCWSFIVYCLCKMPKHYDVFLIRKEINGMTIFYAIINSWFLATRITGLDTKYMALSWMHAYVVMIECMGFAAMPTLWPHYNSLRSMIAEQSTKRHMIRNNSAGQSNANVQTWRIYVNSCSDDTNWNVFINHLIREFAVENLCFLLEAIQFKQQFIPNYPSLFDNNPKCQIKHDEFGWFMKTPDCLPKSTIIENNGNDYKLQIKQIYEKYIALNANLCINISYESRQTFMESMSMILNDNKDIDFKRTESESATFESELDDDHELKMKILTIFDNALFDINLLLNGSFFRCKCDDHKQDIIDVIMAIDKTSNKIR